MIGRGCRDSEVHARKSLYCHRGNVGKNTDIKDISVRVQKEQKETWRETFCLRDYIYHYEQIVHRGEDLKGHSGEVTDGNEEYQSETEGQSLV